MKLDSLAITRLEWMFENQPALVRELHQSNKLEAALESKVQQALAQFDKLRKRGLSSDEALQLVTEEILAPSDGSAMSENPPQPLPEMSGLDNVFLAGIEVRYCTGCGLELPVIPMIEKLHEQIVKYLVFKQDLLSGKEIKFLRKNAGIPANEFAELIGVDASHLSRVENGKTGNLGHATDKLARAVAIAANNGADLRKILLEIANRLRDKKAVFTIKRDNWEKLAALKQKRRTRMVPSYAVSRDR
jgi:transcriptional regulator with XRE-family HTH domain/uncharacterized protein YoaH (UPF0181 family)